MEVPGRGSRRLEVYPRWGGMVNTPCSPSVIRVTAALSARITRPSPTSKTNGSGLPSKVVVDERVDVPDESAAAGTSGGRYTARSGAK